MKTFFQWVLFAICVAVFLALRLHGFSKKEEPRELQTYKPSVPDPVVVLTHPWIQAQPYVEGADLEITRDLMAMPEGFTALAIENLASLQKEVPFSFPEELYNVLCITEKNVYQRLYLGDTELGLPFYLDVKVFELENEEEVDEILERHFQVFKEGREAVKPYLEHAYLGHGMPISEHGHGFAELQGERGMFLYPIVHGHRLFLAYAEAPWSTFEKALPYFKRVVSTLPRSLLSIR